MAKKPRSTWLVDEVAEFLAGAPSREELLAYRPSIQAQQRIKWLIGKSKSESLTVNEEWELDQFEHLEALIQSIKARLRSRRPVAS
jgi:hypothetical protein